MNNQSFFIDLINKVLTKTQFLTNFDLIDNFIFISILLIFILSTFVTSEVLGILALGIFGLTVINMLIKKGENFEMNLFEKFIFIWFLIVFASLLGSTLFHLSLKGFFKTVTYICFYISVVQFYRKNLKLIIPTMFVISFCAISQGLIGISQNFRGVEEISTWQDVSSINPEAVMTRIYGSLKPLNPNLFGGYLVAVIPSMIACLDFLISKKRYEISLGFSIGILLTVIALVLSGCRGAYVALGFMILCFVLYFGKLIFEYNNEKFKQMYLYIVSASITLMMAAAMLVTSIRTRILSIFVLRADSSTSFRFNVYQAVVQMIKDNWLFGIGVGNKNFREIYGLYMKTGFDALSTYNVFTELWVESGIFALISYLLFLFFLIKASVQYILKTNPYRTVVAVCLISILSVMVHGVFDTIYFRPQVQFVFWTMVGFISSVLYAQKSENS